MDQILFGGGPVPDESAPPLVRTSGRVRKSPPPEDPAWHERQRRVEVYRARLEAGKGLFADVQAPERPLDELIKEEQEARAAAIAERSASESGRVARRAEAS